MRRKIQPPHINCVDVRKLKTWTNSIEQYLSASQFAQCSKRHPPFWQFDLASRWIAERLNENSEDSLELPLHWGQLFSGKHCWELKQLEIVQLPPARTRVRTNLVLSIFYIINNPPFNWIWPVLDNKNQTLQHPHALRAARRFRKSRFPVATL